MPRVPVFRHARRGGAALPAVRGGDRFRKGGCRVSKDLQNAVCARGGKGGITRPRHGLCLRYLHALPRFRVLEHHPVAAALRFEGRGGQKRAIAFQGGGRRIARGGGHAVAYVARALFVADDADGVKFPARKFDARPARKGDALFERLFGRAVFKERFDLALYFFVIASSRMRRASRSARESE